MQLSERVNVGKFVVVSKKRGKKPEADTVASQLQKKRSRYVDDMLAFSDDK